MIPENQKTAQVRRNAQWVMHPVEKCSLLALQGACIEKGTVLQRDGELGATLHCYYDVRAYHPVLEHGQDKERKELIRFGETEGFSAPS